MVLLQSSSCIMLMFLLFNIATPSCCEYDVEESSHVDNKDSYRGTFITVRMRHLTAINDIKQMKNTVKRYQLITDLCQKVSKVLDENRRLLAGKGPIDFSANISTLDKSSVIEYLENTAFFCDLLVFFPEITAKLLEKNLLWRITLIDSIQDVMSLKANFVDENTLSQFRKAFQILSEGVVPTEPSIDKKSKQDKKQKRGPRLASANEL